MSTDSKPGVAASGAISGAAGERLFSARRQHQHAVIQLAAHQVGHQWRHAAVRHVLGAGAGGLVDHFARQVQRGAHARRPSAAVFTPEFLLAASNIGCEATSPKAVKSFALSYLTAVLIMRAITISLVEPRKIV
ncbi:hypothetical protein G6F65_021433 [Rhizopus arrhizus]|nr:hypothetical protein G6F65_021433 [Rhizopus arrhizus]